MAVSYLGKKKLYKVAEALGFVGMPKLKDCDYSYSKGVEWFSFYCSDSFVKLSVQFGGKWFWIYQEDENLDLLRDERLSSDEMQICSRVIFG